MKRGIIALLLLLFLAPAFSLLHSQLSCESEGFTWMPNSNYPATYSFTDDELGSIPLGWEYYAPCTGCDSKIVNFLGHNKVLRIYDASASEGIGISSTFSSEASIGSIEFYMLSVNNSTPDLFKGGIIFFNSSGTSTYGPNFGFYNGKISYYDGVVNNWVSLIPYESGRWYHVRLDFDCSKGTYGQFDIYINGVLIKQEANFYRSINKIGRIVSWGASGAIYDIYLDALSYSWDPDYHVGDNLMGGCCGDDVIDLRKGLLSEWHFDEGTGAAAYENISSNTGTLYNSPAWVSGKHGSALNYNGVNQYADFSPSILHGACNGSISLWFKRGAWHGDYSTLLTKSSGCSWANNHIQISRNYNTNTIVFVVSDNSQYKTLVTSAINENQWYHLLMKWDGAYFSAYVDGVLIGRTASTVCVSSASTRFSIAREAAGCSANSRTFNGTIDEVRIYNYAISDREVKYLYEMSPYSYTNYADTFYNGTANIDASYCVNNDFYTNLEQASKACNDYGFNYIKKDWMDEGFKYRKNITIANSGSALTDYQVVVNHSTYNTTGLVASYHFSDEGSSVKDYSGNNNHGSLYGSTVGLWHFDEGAGTSAYDSTSNFLTATLSGATFNLTAISGSSVRFNTDDSVSIPDSDKLSFTDGSGTDKPFSFSFWVKPESSGNQWLINKRSASGNEWQMYLYTGALGFTCFGSGGSTEYITANITNPLILNQWNYITATYDGSELSSGMNIYLNGVILATNKTKSAGYAGMSNTVSNLFLGVAGWNPGLYFNGTMDELSIYNKQLSADEVKSLYYSKKAKFIEYSEGYESKGNGIKLCGNNCKDYMQIPDSASLRPSALTISLWAKADSLAATREFFLTKWTGYSMELDTSNRAFFRVYTAAPATVDSPVSLPLIAGKWYHLVGTYDTVNGNKLYINGQLIGTTAANGALNHQANSLTIGRYLGDSASFFEGTIDEVQIYSRSLSSQEISDLYNERKGRLDYADLRFYNSSGNELNYYLEYDNTSWVKVPIIPAGNSNITMYYGNPSATSRSDESVINAVGGNVSYYGNYRIHTFNNSGKLKVYRSMNVEALVIAGGGAGGTSGAAGGGGAGGLIYNASYLVSAQSYAITVGAGGSTSGANGSTSVFGTLAAIGGGGGSSGLGANGGSGGGSGRSASSTSYKGLGTAGQGYDGGTAGYYSGQYPASGGGGSGAVGQSVTSATPGTSGYGGAGASYSISGLAVTYSGGGGGGGDYYSGRNLAPGAGGGGGGGAGGDSVNGNGFAGTPNTGGGGGGATQISSGASGSGGSGGSGIVIIRYLAKSSNIAAIPNPEESIYGNSTGLLAYYSFDNDVNNKTEDSIGKNHGSLFGSTVGVWRFDDYYSSPKDSTSYLNNGGLKANTVALWHFDEGTGTTTKDETGYGFTGTLINTPAWTMDSISGNTLYFDGTDDYINAGDIDLSSTRSYSVWFKKTDSRTYAFLMAKEDSGYTSEFDFGTTSTSLRVVGYYNGATHFDISGGNIILNKWHHGAWTYDGSTVRLYLDGVQVNTVSFASGITLNNNQLQIGSRRGGVDSPWIGYIDEVAIYNKTLTQTEITELYASKKAKFIEYNNDAKSGQSLLFDGTDDYLSIPDSTNLDLINNISISFWTNSSDITGNRAVMTKIGSGISTFNYGVLISGGKIRWLDTSDYVDTTNAYISNNVWYHVVVTYSSGSVKYYVDGSLKETKTSTATVLTPNSYPLIIGMANTYGQYFKGIIDEVSIHNKTLTSDEVKYLYDSKKAQFMEHVQGAKGKGIEFNGINNNITINDSTSLDISSKITVSLWVWSDRSPSDTEFEDLLGKGNAYDFKFDNTVLNGMTFRIYDASAWHASPIVTTEFIPNTWNHLVGTYDGSTVRIYVNGVQKGSGTSYAGDIDLTSNNLIIGAGGGAYFDGTIDDLKIYNRALSAAEVSEMYSSNANNYGCCGNDYNMDTFYNGSIGTTTHFCQAGSLINQEIDANQTICTYYDYNWLTQTTTSGNYPRCCNDDSSNDLFSAFNADLLTSQSSTCERCNAGAFVSSAIYYGNSYMPGEGTIRTCYYGNIICAGNSGSNGTSSNIFGWGWANDSLSSQVVECKSAAATCTDGSSGNDSTTILYGNGYKSETTCYYGAITCGLNSEASGATCTLLSSLDSCVPGQGCLNYPTLTGTASINNSINSGLGSYINLTWSSNGILPTGYYLENSLDGITYAQLIQTSLTNYVDYSATVDNTMHYYRIKSYNSTYNSTYAYLNISTADRTAYNASILYLNNNINSATVTNLMNDSGLVLYMPFEENAGTITKDWSVNNFTGAITGTSWADGNYGKSLTFDGSGDYINLGTGSSNIGGGNFSLCAWIKTTGTEEDIVSTEGSAWENGNFLFMSYNTKLRGHAWYSLNPNVIDSNAVVNDGSWKYCCQVVDDTNISLYINGILDKTQALVGTKIGSTDTILIGSRRALTNTYNFAGSIDEVRIYSRALSQREIINDMQSGKPYFEVWRSNVSTTNYSLLNGFFDDFNDASYTDKWTCGGSCVQSEGKIIVSNTTGPSASIIPIGLGLYDDFVWEADVTPKNLNQQIAVFAFRRQSNGWAHYVWASGASIYVQIYNGSYNNLHVIPYSFEVDVQYNFKISMINDTIKVYINDIQLSEVKNTQIPNEQQTKYIYIYSVQSPSITQFDNIKITPLNNNLVTDSSAADASNPNTPASPTVTLLSTTSLEISWSNVADSGNTYYYYSKNIDNSGNSESLTPNGGMEKDSDSNMCPDYITCYGSTSVTLDASKGEYAVFGNDTYAMLEYQTYIPNSLGKTFKLCADAKQIGGSTLLFYVYTGKGADSGWQNFGSFSPTNNWKNYCSVTTVLDQGGVGADAITKIRFYRYNQVGTLLIDNMELYEIKNVNVMSGVNSYQANGSDATISGWTNSAVTVLNRECFTNYSYSVKAKDNANNIGGVSTASIPVYPISFIPGCSGSLGFCVNSQKCYVPFNCSGFDCQETDCDGAQIVSERCVAEKCDTNGYSFLNHETVNGCSCVSEGTCDEGYCQSGSTCNYAVTCGSSGWSASQCTSTSGCTGDCNLGLCNYSLGGNCSAIGCGEGELSDHDPDEAMQFCTGCSQEWAGSSCCGDDGDESFSNEGVSKPCCYNGELFSNNYRSSSLLCYNGLMYDCNNQASDPFPINSNTGESKGEFTCTDSNTWSGQSEAYTMTYIETQSQLLYFESGSDAQRGMSFNITNPSNEYLTYELELSYTQGYSQFSETQSSTQTITVPPSSTKTVYIDVYPTIVGDIMYTLSAANLNNPEEYFVRQFTTTIIMPIEDESGQIIYSADELTIFDFIVSFLNKIFFR